MSNPCFDLSFEHAGHVLKIILNCLSIAINIYQFYRRIEVENHTLHPCYKRIKVNDCTLHSSIRFLDLMTNVGIFFIDLQLGINFCSWTIIMVLMNVSCVFLKVDTERTRFFMAYRQALRDEISEEILLEIRTSRLNERDWKLHTQ